MKHLCSATVIGLCGLGLVFAASCASSAEGEYSALGQAIEAETGNPQTVLGLGSGLERGTVSVTQPNRATWHTAMMNRQFTSPVVVMGPASYNGVDPLAGVRVRNIQLSQFEFKLDEWAYLDGAHVAERLSYVVAEEGVRVLPDARRLEAGQQVDVTHEWTAVTFPQAFAVIPVVVAQCVTYNGSNPIVTRLRNITTTGFEVALFEEEAGDGVHNPEIVHWIAAPPRNSTAGARFGVARTPVEVTDAWYTMALPNQGSPALAVARIQTFNGSDPASLRARNPQPASIQLFIEEETSQDAETVHAAEAVGAFAFPLLGATCRVVADCGTGYSCCADDGAEVCETGDISCSCRTACD